MAPDIPGHYYGTLLPVSNCFDRLRSECLAESVIDPEKKKYFKIQPNHAIPSAAKHSRQAVNAQKAAIKVRPAFSLRLEHLFSVFGFHQRHLCRPIE
jgi:hypothetical protein